MEVKESPGSAGPADPSIPLEPPDRLNRTGSLTDPGLRDSTAPTSSADRLNSTGSLDGPDLRDLPDSTDS